MSWSHPPVAFKSNTSIRVWNRQDRMNNQNLTKNSIILEKENKGRMKEIEKMKSKLMQSKLMQESDLRMKAISRKTFPSSESEAGCEMEAASSSSQIDPGTTRLQRRNSDSASVSALRRRATYGKSLNQVCNASADEKYQWEQGVLRHTNMSTAAKDASKEPPTALQLRRAVTASRASSGRGMRTSQSCVGMSDTPASRQSLLRAKSVIMPRSKSEIGIARRNSTSLSSSPSADGFNMNTDMEPRYIRKRVTGSWLPDNEGEMEDDAEDIRFESSPTLVIDEVSPTFTMGEDYLEDFENYDSFTTDETKTQWKPIIRRRSQSWCNINSRQSQPPSTTRTESPQRKSDIQNEEQGQPAAFTKLRPLLNLKASTSSPSLRSLDSVVFPQI